MKVGDLITWRQQGEGLGIVLETSIPTPNNTSKVKILWQGTGKITVSPQWRLKVINASW
tara:strand:+ start:519 stop:695 length:177 start_codon:yes stop_codon:yes gene_type:complete